MKADCGSSGNVFMENVGWRFIQEHGSDAISRERKSQWQIVLKILNFETSISNCVVMEVVANES